MASPRNLPKLSKIYEKLESCGKEATCFSHGPKGSSHGLRLGTHFVFDISTRVSRGSSVVWSWLRCGNTCEAPRGSRGIVCGPQLHATPRLISAAVPWRRRLVPFGPSRSLLQCAKLPVWQRVIALNLGSGLLATGPEGSAHGWPALGNMHSLGSLSFSILGALLQ